MRAKEHQGGGAGSQHGPGGTGWARWDKRGCSATLHGEAKQDTDPRSSTEHSRILWSRAPSLRPPLPQEPWGGLPPPPSPTPPAPSPQGDTAPHPTGGGAAHPGAGAERWLREPNQKFHLEAARGQGLGGSLRRQREGKGGLVQPRSRDGSQFEFLPKDGQQFT